MNESQTNAPDADGGFGGPVSQVLAAELSAIVRQKGVVLWLDGQGDYSAFVDRLIKARAAGRLPYDIVAYRGSYLALMLELEGLANGAEAPQLLIHLPGLTEESVRLTPVLELYRAGTRYRKALNTLVGEAAGGQVRREALDAYLNEGVSTLRAADRWLEGLFGAAKAAGGFEGELQALTLHTAIEALLSHTGIAEDLSHPGAADLIYERLAALSGLHDGWVAASGNLDRRSAQDLAFAVSSWALCVEFVDDLKSAPIGLLLAPAQGLPTSVVVACKALAVHLRRVHPTFYTRAANETEEILGDAVRGINAEDLGQIDTFAFEEQCVLEAAIAALKGGRWGAAADWAGMHADSRTRGRLFWLAKDGFRQDAWVLVAAAADLGLRIDEAGTKLGHHEDLADAVAHYTRLGAPVDRAHRHLKQHANGLEFSGHPQFHALRARVTELEARWRRWADAWAKGFNALCMKHGFLPAAASQQRTLFDDIIRPMAAEDGVTAYFMVDALRYEMAQELFEALADTPAASVELGARLAELPSVTEVGMNVLAPVVRGGMLRPVLRDGKILGFGNGEFRVSDPKTRKRTIANAVGGGTCPWLKLEEVLNRDAGSLKKAVAQAKIVVVHSIEIDKAGENGAGLSVFQEMIRKLRVAWQRLREVGIRRFVITADHGFLVSDDHTLTRQKRGRKVDPKRRHLFTELDANHPGEMRISLAKLGYEGAPGYLVLPETTAVFDTGDRAMGFVHGGNSLQERVIPVLTMVHRAAAGGSTDALSMEARKVEGQGNMHALAIEVSTPQGGLGFTGPKRVELALSTTEPSDIKVELCRVHGDARIAAGVVEAPVGTRFTLYFRLKGHTNRRVSLSVAQVGGTANMAAFTVPQRFQVAVDTGNRRLFAPSEPIEGAKDEAVAVVDATPWLDQLPEGGVRELFTHLETHGSVTEQEAVKMLGGPRKHRRFSNAFEGYAELAPFDTRIEFMNGQKRYVREGAK